MTRIAILGAGNVGGAFYGCAREALGEDALILCDTDARRIANIDPGRATPDAGDAASRATTVVIAVKPQSFPALARQLAGRIEQKLVVSVMAGVSLRSIQDSPRVRSVVRAMPNLGAQVRRCVTAWMAAECAADQRERARKPSARLLESGERTAGEWRNAVTTPGGTTQAALNAMVFHGLPEAFRLGLEAARRRSQALNARDSTKDRSAGAPLPEGPV